MTVERRSALLRGALDLCVLALLERRAVYGYEVTTEFQSMGLDVSGGSVYPLLARLERAGQISSEVRPSSEGPPRKYYLLSPTGALALEEGRGDWAAVSRSIDGVLTMPRSANREAHSC